jgi:HAD superfamily hydrolase (TIGR01509 family)
LPLGVIFDIDGTLVDSNDAHASAWLDALKEFGFTEVQFEKVRRMIGMGGDKILPELTGLEEESGRGKKLLDRRKEIFLRNYLPSLKAFPCSRELVERIRAEGMITVVATSANNQELTPLLRAAGVDDLMQGTTSSSDAKESKPDPDIVEAAVRKTHLRAEQLIMLGDTPYDVEAASRAGVPIVAVRCGGWSDRELDGALAVYDDPADILHNFDRTHFARPR